MTSSQRSKLGAVGLFSLIALVVIGGMSWATVSSYELAKKTVNEEHIRTVSQAVRDMDSYMTGIIYAESWRDYWHYWGVFPKKPLAAFGRNDLEVNVNRVILQSPLAESGPTHDWIDLYFRIDENGSIASPHLANDESPWALDASRQHIESERRTLQSWEWLQTVLPKFNLHEAIASACSDEHLDPTGDGIAPTHVDPDEAREADHGALASDAAASANRNRQRSLLKAQESYLPSPACIEAEIARQTASRPTDSNLYDTYSTNYVGPPDPSNVEIRVGRIAAFWLGEGPNGHQKLGFVREVMWDAAVHYQGFIADWTRLKSDLLAQIENKLPAQDLQPILSDEDESIGLVESRMEKLPARLAVPDVEGGVAMAAWQKVRGTLITTWMAAGVVLVVAGVGLRNLVALTERRMQFAYAVTHELRTPLTTFRLYSDMLSAGLVPEDSKQQYVDTLNRESLRLSSLVEGVLEYARLENQRVKLSQTETDASTLLNGIAEHLQRHCSEYGVTPKTENNVTNGQRVRTDIDVVTRIAGVLVNNACRHARENKNPAVLVTLGGDNGRFYLDVADSGTGVDRTDSRAIFKPFRRGKSADRAARGGIGLGLALAKNWATLLGGHLELFARHHTTLGGAHFRLTIPSQPPNQSMS